MPARLAVPHPHLAVGEDAVRAALRLNLAAEPLDGRQQVHRALHGLRDAPAAARLRRRADGTKKNEQISINDRTNGQQKRNRTTSKARIYLCRTKRDRGTYSYTAKPASTVYIASQRLRGLGRWGVHGRPLERKMKRNKERLLFLCIK